MEAAIEGLLTGGQRGRPYLSSFIDLRPYGYEEHEYVVGGRATPYSPAHGSDFGQDGHWRVVPRDAVPYRTRVLVRRPPAERFNGTVLIEFLQEYTGVERDSTFRWNAEAILREGFAWVGASLHRGSVDGPGSGTEEFGGGTVHIGPTLHDWDPERYGTLSYPHSDICYDVLSDIGKLFGPGRATDGDDPLAGLPVRHLLAMGNSVCALRLQQYINAVQPLERVFDAFYLQDLHHGHGTEGQSMVAGTPPSPTWVRTDAGVPVIILQTTTAATLSSPQPDGPNVRLWEVAGSSHTTGPFMVRVAEATKRDMDFDLPVCPPNEANTLPVQYVSGAALVALHRWVNGGTPAGSFPPIERTGEAPDATIGTDQLGNVTGGLRTPWVDVPIARYDWRGDCLGGAGRTFWFTPEQLTELYDKPENYRLQFAVAAEQAEANGVLLPEDARTARDQAATTSW